MVADRAGPQNLADASRGPALPFRIVEAKMIPQAIGQGSVYSIAKPSLEHQR